MTIIWPYLFFGVFSAAVAWPLSFWPFVAVCTAIAAGTYLLMQE